MFFKQVKVRKGKISLMYLLDHDGNRIEDVDGLNRHSLGFYQELLATTDQMIGDFVFPQGKSMDCSLHENFVDIPSKEDIKQAVWNIGINKSPGPGGFNS